MSRGGGRALVMCSHDKGEGVGGFAWKFGQPHNLLHAQIGLGVCGTLGTDYTAAIYRRAPGLSPISMPTRHNYCV